MLYSIKLYIGIITSRPFALFIWVLFILLMQPANGAQFLSITPLFFSSPYCAAASSSSPVIIIVPFISMYASLCSNQFDFNIVVSNLIWLLISYTFHVSNRFNPISYSIFRRWMFLWYTRNTFEYLIQKIISQAIQNSQNL